MWRHVTCHVTLHQLHVTCHVTLHRLHVTCYATRYVTLQMTCTWNGGRARQLTPVLETLASHCPQDLQHRTYPAPWEKHQRQEIRQCMHVHLLVHEYEGRTAGINLRVAKVLYWVAKIFALFLEVSSLHCTLFCEGRDTVTLEHLVLRWDSSVVPACSKRKTFLNSSKALQKSLAVELSDVCVHMYIVY